MWSPNQIVSAGHARPGSPRHDELLVARMRMEEALHLLDAHSASAAAASLDLALHQLDRELSTH